MRGIVIFEGNDLDRLRTLFNVIGDLDTFNVRFYVHQGKNGGLQVKVNGGMWTPTYGRLEDAGEAGPTLKDQLREVVTEMKGTATNDQGAWNRVIRQLEELTA